MMKSTVMQAYSSLSARQRLSTLTVAVLATFVSSPAIANLTVSKDWTANDNNVDHIYLDARGAEEKEFTFNAKGFDLTVRAVDDRQQALVANKGVTFTLDANNFTTLAYVDNRPLSGIQLTGAHGTLNLTGDLTLTKGRSSLSSKSDLTITAQNISMAVLSNKASTATYTAQDHIKLDEIQNHNGSILNVTANTMEVNGSIQSWSRDDKGKDLSEPANNMKLTTKGDFVGQSVRLRTNGFINIVSEEGNVTVLHHSGWSDALIYQTGEGLIQAKNGTVRIGTKGGKETTGITASMDAEVTVDGKNVEIYGTSYAKSGADITLRAGEKFLLNENKTFNNQSFNITGGSTTRVEAPDIKARGSIRVSDAESKLSIDSSTYVLTGENRDPYFYAGQGGTIELNAKDSGRLESLTPGSAKAYLYLSGGTLKLGGAKHSLDGWAYFDADKNGNKANFALLDQAQKGQTTFTVENYSLEKSLETKAVHQRSALSISNSDIDFTGLNGEFRVSSKNAYQGFASSADLKDAVAVRVVNGGSLTLDEASYTLAGTVLSNGKSSAGTTLTIGKDAKVDLYGDAIAVNGGAMDVTLSSDSTWEGFGDAWVDLADGSTMTHVAPVSDPDKAPVQVFSGGELNVTMAGGLWKNRGLSSISTLSFEEPQANARMLRMARVAVAGTDPATRSYNGVDLTNDAGGALYADTVKGKTGSFRMLFNSDHTKGNMLYMKNVADGADANFTVDAVIPDGVNPTALEGLRFATTGKVTNDSLFTVQSENDGFNNIKYEVKNEAFDATNADNADYNDGDFKPGSEWVSKQFADGLNWYLAKPVVEVSEGGEVVLGTARSLYWQSVELDRLNKRLGERRMSREGDNGLWIRLRHSRLGTDTGSGDFTSRNTTYQVGYDYTHAESDGKRLFGFAVDYRDGNTDYDTVRGDGEANRFGLTAYSTWLADSGWYWDAVAKWGRLHHSFDIVNNSGKSVRGDFHNNAYGLSFELGRKLAQAESAWFLEPQAQVQFTTVSGGHYYTNQGSFVDQDRINSFVSRLGVRAGRTLGEEKTGEIYAKADWLREWHGKQRMSVTDKTTGADGTDASISHKGNWFDVGLGLQHTLTQNTYAYVDVEYRFGNDLERTWDVNAGLRWQF